MTRKKLFARTMTTLLSILLVFQMVAPVSFAKEEEENHESTTNEFTGRIFLVKEDGTKVYATGDLEDQTLTVNSNDEGEIKFFDEKSEIKEGYRISASQENINGERTSFHNWIKRNGNKFFLYPIKSVEKFKGYKIPEGLKIKGGFTYRTKKNSETINGDLTLVVKSEQNEPNKSETANDDQIVEIPDNNLKKIVYEEIKKTNPNITMEKITVGDLKKIEKIKADYGDIYDLTGLEYASNLQSIILNDNHIADITPLKLTRKQIVRLNRNNISIKPEKDEIELPIKAHEQNKITYNVDEKYGTIENNVLKLKKQDKNFKITFDSHQGGYLLNTVDSGEIIPNSTYDFKGEISVDVSKVNWKQEPQYENGHVYFKYKDGRKVYVDEKNTITLKVTDEGTFHLEGEETEDVVVEKFISEEKYKIDKNHSGYVIKNGEYGFHYLIDANRNFNPRTAYKEPKLVSVRFNHKGKPSETKNFYIKIVPSEIEEIRVLKDGKVIEDVVKLKGSEIATITVEGRRKGTDKFELISPNAYYIKDNPKQHVMKNSFTLWTWDKEHKVEVIMRDNNDVKSTFKAQSEFVNVTDFSIKVPERWPIHKWNSMSEKYVGVRQYDEGEKDEKGNPKGYSIEVIPANASSWEMKWEALNPDIAEYDPLHSNGIVPKKPGKAKFKVSSVLNPSLVKEVEVEFYYENPLQSAEVSEKEYRLEVNEEKNIEINTNPVNASEQRFKWSYSKEGIVEVEDTVNVDVENVNTEKWTTHTLKGLKEGKVEVTGTPVDDTKSVKPIKFTVIVGKGEPEEPAKDPLRIAGSDRYETSLKVAEELRKHMKVDKFDAVVVAYGDKYADALSGAYLAKVNNAPLLLINENNMQGAIDYINKYLKSGKSSKVYLLGGNAVMPETMRTKLENNFTVKRISGADRFETNMAILKEAGVNNEEILICSGYGFADSLSASASGRPILMVGDALSSDQLTYLKSISSRKYNIIGGYISINKSVENALKEMGTTSRVFGQDRYKTSIEIAKFLFNKPKGVVIGYGDNFPDGLCGGVLAEKMGVPLLLVNGNNTESASEYVKSNSIKEQTVLGGKTLITDVALNAIIR